MSVAPVPVMPTEPAVPEAASSGPPAPGFADALEAAQQDGPPTAPVPGKPKLPGEAGGDVTDVIAMLAALTGVPRATPDTPTAAATATDVSAIVGSVVGGSQPLTDQTQVAETVTVDAPVPAPAPKSDDKAAPAPTAATADGVTPATPPPPTVPVAPVVSPAPADAKLTANTDAAALLAALTATEPDSAAVKPTGARANAGPAPEIVQATATTAGGMIVAPRADAAAAAAPVATASPNTPPAPAPPADQLFGLMRPLQRAEDGSYHLRMELRPPELGRVDLRVELRDGVLHATIHTEHSSAAEIVRAALDDLRARLDADGMRAGTLTVNDGSSQSERRREQASNTGAPGDEAVAEAAALVTGSTETNPDALLDVRI